MSAPMYTRPTIDAPVFRDDAGEVIPYGNRWSGLPPEDTYSVDTHPERFAPLHTVAAALIEYLCAAFDVARSEGPDYAADLNHTPTEVARAVRLTPNDPASASLTFVFTTYPGVLLHAGLVHDFFFPICGCDACDSSWDAEADQLERTVFAVVGGGYRESIDGRMSPWIEHKLTFADEGWTSGRARAGDFPSDRVKSALPVLRAGDSWSAWPPR